MKTSAVFSLMLFCQFAWSQTDYNTISGKIDLPEVRASFLNQGANYKPKNSGSSERQELATKNDPKYHVYISLHPLDFAPLLSPMEANITQRAKTFYPNVVAVTKGSTINFLNEDEHYHNIHSVSRKARFNIGRRPPGNVYKQKINTVGVVRLGCDIHDEMSAVIISLDTPYFAKIRMDATYQITDLPDGKYEIRAYHPAFPRYTDVIEVSGGAVIKNINMRIP